MTDPFVDQSHARHRVVSRDKKWDAFETPRMPPVRSDRDAKVWVETTAMGEHNPTPPPHMTEEEGTISRQVGHA